jgi:cytochrome c-type biogenesis protein CcmH
MRWLGALVLFAALACAIAATPTVTSVASQLHPPDCASDMSAADCPTQMADQFRAQILADLDRGESAQQIVSEFEQQYGPGVLALPSRGGIGALAWWLPPIALVIGAGVASVLVRAWRRRGMPRGDEPPPPEPGREISAEVRARM